jgi:hypothetical protein
MALTLLDIAKMNGSVGDLVEDSLAAAPEAERLPARTISGYSFKSLHRTTVPSIGFRDINEGNAAVQSVYKTRLHETFTVDASSEVDKALAQQSEDGVDVVLAREARGMMIGATRGMGSQLWYGTASTIASSTATNASKGFQGAVQFVDSSLVVDVGGVGSAASSAWAVKFGEDGVQWILGDGGAFDTEDPRIVRLTDSNSNPYDGYRTPMLFNLGIYVANQNAFGRIKNITAAATVTDDDFYTLISNFPVGHKPDAVFMTPRTLEQLRASRTATNTIGAPAPTPTTVADNYPIIVTNNIVDTETAG